MSDASWSVYLSGEIHSDWRERIRSGAESAGLEVEFLSPVTEHAASDDAGVDMNKSIATSCGSGVTASVTAFALNLLGHDEIPVYDGSWAEWGDHPDTPVGP